jgi:hypothetical protein
MTSRRHLNSLRIFLEVAADYIPGYALVLRRAHASFFAVYLCDFAPLRENSGGHGITFPQRRKGAKPQSFFDQNT